MDQKDHSQDGFLIEKSWCANREELRSLLGGKTGQTHDNLATPVTPLFYFSLVTLKALTLASCTRSLVATSRDLQLDRARWGLA